jgi:putative ABC transport system permease protein
LQSKFPAFVEKKMGPQLRSWNEWMVFTLQPISSIHLNSNAPDELEPNGSAQATNFLALIAVLILVMAWINYINLATARSMERAKEVGIRKVLGGFRSQLIRQFLLESFTFKLIASLITIVLVALLLPYFSLMIGRTINWHIFDDVNVWIFILIVFGVGVMCTSLYPALVMSAFKPVSILKGRFQSSLKGIYVRKSLVTVQFVSSVVLIVGAFVVYRQLHFMRNASTGIDTEQVLVINGLSATDSTYFSRFKTLCQSLQQYPSIKKVTVSTDVPGHHVRWANGNVRLVGQDEKMGHSFEAIMTDENFIDAFGFSLIEGRNFSGKLKDQWKSVIVNETAMKLLGFTESAEVIGRKIYLWDDEPEIIGVIKDYHQESVKQIIKPLILVYDQKVSDFYSVKIKTDKPINETVKRVETKYKETFPGNPFHYFFLEDHYNQQYKSDQQFGKVFGLFTIIGIVIACLGLFGLSSYSVMQRTKEIGIRKVLGASVKQITILISKEFILIVLLANVVAWPISYLLMDNWLSGFANRINLGVLSFLVPGVIALLIAILTVASQSIKAASADPVNSLKSE